MTARRCIIYVRQSITAVDSDSVSLDMQERECRMWAAKNDAVVLEPAIVDPDAKGWDPLRPGIRELLARLETDKPDVVVVYAMSRFARDYVLAETIWRQIKERGASLVSVHEPHAEDDLVRGILGVVSQAERARMGAFLSSAFAERARRGLIHGRTPFGYRKIAGGHIEPNPDDAPYLVGAVERAEQGWSLWRIARWLQQSRSDDRTWEPNAVRKMLSTPAIKGTVKTGDVVTDNAHEPLIDAERWQRLQEWLGSRTPQKRKGASSWLEGMIRCGCGAPLYLIAPSHPGNKPQFKCAARHTFQTAYEPCTHNPRSILMHLAEDRTAERFVDDMRSVLDWREVLADATRTYKDVHSTATMDRRRIEKRIREVDAEGDRLLSLYRRGTLDVERWEREDTSISATLTALRDELATLPTAPDADSIQNRGQRLALIASSVDDLVRDDPAGIRDVLYALDAFVQLTKDGPVIRWPADVRAFIGAYVNRESFLFNV